MPNNSRCCPSFRHSVLLVLLAFFAGCQTVDVGPYYDAAIAKYDAARTLEINLVNHDVTASITQQVALLNNIEQLTKAQLTQMIMLQWSPTQQDFELPTREAAWRAIAGIGADQPLLPELATLKKPILQAHLREEIYSVTVGNNLRSITGVDVLKAGGVGNMVGPVSSPDPIKDQKKFEKWVKTLDQTVFGSMPTIENIAALRMAIEQSYTVQKQHRLARVDSSYERLIDITRTTKQFAETLTKNARFISLANKILESANTALGNVPSVDSMIPTAALGDG